MTQQAVTRIILVRHGQTPCNADNRWHGWENCDLTDTGREQAEAAGDRLSGMQVDALYSSDLNRAVQTAEAIGRHHRLAPMIDVRLRERSAGCLEGLHADEVAIVAPTWERDRSSDVWGWAPPGGETFRQVLDRSLAAVLHIVENHPGGTAVAVTHMGPLRVLISHFAGIPLGDTYLQDFPSTGITVFAFAGDQVRVEAINSALHVAAGAREQR